MVTFLWRSLFPLTLCATIGSYFVSGSPYSEIVELPVTSNVEYLFDINVDPYERNDIIQNPEYADILKVLRERRDYWANLTIESSTDESVKSLPVVKKDHKKTKKLYHYDDAPNIVYVLIDDWGYNDFGARSTYMSWTTPHLNNLADEGILLENFYTNEVCGPSRASLLTGRYALRVGIVDPTGALPLSETTLAEELRTAGYRSYIVGKWHLGTSSRDYFPTSRGFDYFYGYVDGYEDYWTKHYGDKVDIYENYDQVTDEHDLDPTLHSAYLFQSKAEKVVKYHATNYPDTPMFLYYPMQLVHYPWTAPEIYLERCTNGYADEYFQAYESADSDTVPYNYCAMMVMMDEAIANLTCTLAQNGFADNTVMIISGDNGGEETISGNSFPFRGHKDTAMRGAFSNTAIIHSSLIPKDRRGTKYTYDVHITDWLPTIMGLATGGQWTGSMSGAELDGVNVWSNVLSGTQSPRVEMVFASKPSTYESAFVAQLNGIKYIYNCALTDQFHPAIIFHEDLDSELSHTFCPNPSLISASQMYHYLRSKLYQNDGAVMSEASSFLMKLFALVAVISTIVVLLSSLSTYYDPIYPEESKNLVGKETDPLIVREKEIHTKIIC